MRKACIDVGSNSILLTVEEFDGKQWFPVFEDSAVTALGEGVKASRVLSERGMKDSLEAILQFHTKALENGASSLIIGGTMAVRMALNQSDFLQRGLDQGTPIQVISGEVEAQLGFESVAYDSVFANYSRLSIIDPGGQSTELITADRPTNPVEPWNILFRRSFPIGTLALRGGILSSESPTSSELLQATFQLDEIIGLTYLPQQAGTAVVLGATGTNLVCIRDQITEWDPKLINGAKLDGEEVSQAVGQLSRLTDSGRAQIIGMEPGRERTIHLGCLILERFLFALREIECKVSVRGWRHALIERGFPKNI